MNAVPGPSDVQKKDPLIIELEAAKLSWAEYLEPVPPANLNIVSCEGYAMDPSRLVADIGHAIKLVLENNLDELTSFAEVGSFPIALRIKIQARVASLNREKTAAAATLRPQRGGPKSGGVKNPRQSDTGVGATAK